MKTSRYILALFLALGLLPAVAQNSKPNILVILMDDMGYSDPGCYGGEMATPAIDSLAQQGVRLTHFENCGMCVLSRSAMLTGNYWTRMKKEFSKTPILPEKLHEAGYRTGLFGKWHMRGDPMDRGFDHFFGFHGGANNQFGGGKDFYLDRAPFSNFGDHYYSADAYTDHAVDFLKHPDRGQEQKPFFLYLAYSTPHSPLQAPKEDILKNRGKYLVGWQAVRETRFKHQTEMGLVPADSSLPDYPKNLPDWKTLSPQQRDLEDLRMCTYAAMVERTDKGIARVLAALKESGKADNTLILFMSDNGADPFSVADAKSLPKGVLPGDTEGNWQLGMGWAYASVTPWRLYKISQFGGGVMTGAIVCWPGKTGKPGSVENSPAHFVDILPTFLEAAGVSKGGLNLAGESFLPMIQGKPWQRKGPRYFQFTNNRAISEGEWTLGAIDGQGWELYHTSVDPFENVNVASKQPEIFQKLNAQWTKWWQTETGESGYTPVVDKGEGHAYGAQGDRGSGAPYVPSAMPANLAGHYPMPAHH